MQLSLILCAFDHHAYGRYVHDDILNRWIRICSRCGKIVRVAGPMHKDGVPYDSHEWIKIENVRSMEELDDTMGDLQTWLKGSR